MLRIKGKLLFLKDSDSSLIQENSSKSDLKESKTKEEMRVLK
jgi:hypothetical protein